MFMREHTGLSDATVTALAETFKVLGDTTRVRILDALSGERTRSEGALAAGIPQTGL